MIKFQSEAAPLIVIEQTSNAFSSKILSCLEFFVIENKNSRVSQIS